MVASVSSAMCLIQSSPSGAGCCATLLCSKEVVRDQEEELLSSRTVFSLLHLASHSFESRPTRQWQLRDQYELAKLYLTSYSPVAILSPLPSLTTLGRVNPPPTLPSYPFPSTPGSVQLDEQTTLLMVGRFSPVAWLQGSRTLFWRTRATAPTECSQLAGTKRGSWVSGSPARKTHEV